MSNETRAYRLPIAGEWFGNGQSMPVLDKYTGEVIGTVPVASGEAVDTALSAAQSAFVSFSRMPAHGRAAILEKAADLLVSDRDEMAHLLVREVGKPWKQAVREVERAIGILKLSAEEAKRIHGETIAMDVATGGEGRLGFYIRCPVGVVAAITPFNVPLVLVAHKLGPCVAAGNSMVLKPASATPLSAIRLAEIFQEAGLPPCVLNIVVGSGSAVGDLLVSDRRVAKISFTGSVPVGLSITRKAGLKKVTMELGSNSGTIVEPDANLDEAAVRCVASAFANAGQICISVQRLYVHKSIFPEFTKRLVDETSKLMVGNPLDADCDVGPMIDEKEAKRAESWIGEAVSGGARVLIGGKREGSVLYPTVLTDVHRDMKVVCMEAFAPLVSVIAYDRFEDAVEMVDDSPYGLQAGIFTSDIRKALYAVERINAGGIVINDTSSTRFDHCPYGGNKMSGLGREGVRFAIDEMTNIKMVVIKP